MYQPMVSNLVLSLDIIENDSNSLRSTLHRMKRNTRSSLPRLVRWIVNTGLSGKYYFRKHYQEDVLTQYPLNRSFFRHSKTQRMM